MHGHVRYRQRSASRLKGSESLPSGSLPRSNTWTSSYPAGADVGVVEDRKWVLRRYHSNGLSHSHLLARAGTWLKVERLHVFVASAFLRLRPFHDLGRSSRSLRVKP